MAVNFSTVILVLKMDSNFIIAIYGRYYFPIAEILGNFCLTFLK